MWITGFGIQILLHKYKAEQTEAICKLLLAFIAHKLQEYQVGTFAAKYSRIAYRPCHFKVFKGCLPHILFGPFLNTLTHLQFLTLFSYFFHNYNITNLKNINPIRFRKYTKFPIKVLLKKSTCSFKTCQHEMKLLYKMVFRAPSEHL